MRVALFSSAVETRHCRVLAKQKVLTRLPRINIITILNLMHQNIIVDMPRSSTGVPPSDGKVQKEPLGYRYGPATEVRYGATGVPPSDEGAVRSSDGKVRKEPLGDRYSQRRYGAATVMCGGGKVRHYS